jgi:hypothetical protein
MEDEEDYIQDCKARGVPVRLNYVANLRMVRESILDRIKDDPFFTDRDEEYENEDEEYEWVDVTEEPEEF